MFRRALELSVLSRAGLVSALRPVFLGDDQRRRGLGWRGRPRPDTATHVCTPGPLAMPFPRGPQVPAAHRTPPPGAERPVRTSTAALTSEEAAGSSGAWGVFVRGARLARSGVWAGIQLMIKPRARALQSMTSMTGSLGTRRSC